MATPLRCLRVAGGQLGGYVRSELRTEILVAGHQKRWQTSSGLGDSNSATEGEFGHVCDFFQQCAQPGSSHVDFFLYQLSIAVAIERQIGII